MKPSTNPSNYLILKSSIKFSAYLLLLALILLLFILTFRLGSSLSFFGWVLIAVFCTFTTVVILSLKRIEVYNEGIKIHLIVRRKSTYYAFEDIDNFEFSVQRASFVKMKMLNLVVKDKTIFISSLFYKNVNKIHEIVAENCEAK